MNKFEDKGWLKGELLGQYNRVVYLTMEVGELRECIAQAKEQRKLLEDRIAALRERIDRLESTYPYDEDGRPF